MVGLLWIEPLRDWVNTSDSAGKLNETNEISEIRAIILKTQSNRAMAGKKIGFNFIPAYSGVNEDKGCMGEAEKTGREKETVKSPENGDIPVWSGRPVSNRRP
jgi:hypothetical protein